MSQLAIPGQLTATSLTLPAGLDIEEWLEVGHTLKRIEGSIQWWVGDWLTYGEDYYGDAMYQALDRADHTLDNWRYVARAISPSRRREDLKFSHHVEVAKLGPQKQGEILERAAEEHLSVRRVREIANEEEVGAFGVVEVVKPRTCPMCGGSGEVPEVVERGE